MATSSAYEGAGAGTRAIRDDTVAVGSHVLEMEGYNKLKAAFRVGECVHSSSFIVGGHSWHLTCYPRGDDNKYKDCIVDLILCLENPGATDEVRARFSFALLGPVGEVLHCWDDEEKTFSSSENSSGCPLVYRRDLDEFAYLHNERFRIRCDIIIVNELRPWGKNVWESPRLDLRRHLGELLAGDVGGDVTFEVAGETFTAHKCILAARSPFFMAEFFGPNNKESITASAHVRVDDMDPKAFKALLHFIYTDCLPKMAAGTDDMVIRMLKHLLVAADRYGMERLKLICDDVLSYHVDARTAATELQLAEKHGCPRLKHACMSLRDLLDNVAL